MNEVENLYFRHHSLSQNPSSADAFLKVGSNNEQSKLSGSFLTSQAFRNAEKDDEHSRLAFIGNTESSVVLADRPLPELLSTNATSHAFSANSSLQTQTEENGSSFIPSNNTTAASPSENSQVGQEHVSFAIGTSPLRSDGSRTQIAGISQQMQTRRADETIWSSSYSSSKPSSPAGKANIPTTLNSGEYICSFFTINRLTMGADFLNEKTNNVLWRDSGSSSLTYDSFWSSHTSGKALANYQSVLALSPSRSDSKMATGSFQDVNNAKLPSKNAVSERMGKDAIDVPEG